MHSIASSSLSSYHLDTLRCGFTEPSNRTSKLADGDVAVGPQKSPGLSLMECKGDAQLLQRQLDEIDVCQTQHYIYHHRCVKCVLVLVLAISVRLTWADHYWLPVRHSQQHFLSQEQFGLPQLKNLC